MINIAWLRTFCTLAEVGHFTRTAERLYMTQSGVSQHIRKLEEQLDTDLLIRQGKQFSLTNAGEQLYKEAGEILQRLSNLEQRIGEDPPYEGLVRLMSPGSVGLKLYPKLLNLQQQHPQLVIDYRFAPNSDIEQALANHEIDIGFMTDGAHHAGMLLTANYEQFQHINDFKKKGFSNQIGLILEPVSRGIGFTVLPAHAVAAYSKPELINSHALPVAVSETLYLAVRRQQVLSNRMYTVIDDIKKWL